MRPNSEPIRVRGIIVSYTVKCLYFKRKDFSGNLSKTTAKKMQRKSPSGRCPSLKNAFAFASERDRRPALSLVSRHV